MEFENIKSFLYTPLSSSGKTSDTYEKRYTNINFIKSLNRDNLGYSETERRLLIHETKDNELLYIQYPGKESVNSNSDINRPWDFRPIILLSDGKRLENDLSFKNIWDIIYTKSIELEDKTREAILLVLAIMFYRMAYMVDNRPTTFFDTQYNDLIINNGVVEIISEALPLKIPLLYKYEPQKKIIDFLYSKCPGSWGGLSIEGFLYYNELLIWNEDCKYYYRNVIINEKKWINDTGRVNTALTHMMIISFLLGKIPLSRLCDGFNRGRGVAPIQKKEINKIYHKFIGLQDRLV
jgi:hypothetical protein